MAGFDGYGGYLGIDLGATGFFRTAHYRERWWIVDPAGHPFFSQGINHVTFDGTFSWVHLGGGTAGAFQITSG